MKCYELGLWSFFSAVLCCIVAAVQLPDLQHDRVPTRDLAIRASNIFCLVVFLFASVSLPRRPHVIFAGNRVDGEWTVSALNRLTWGWANSILRVARLKGDLTLSDIPWVESFLRAKSLVVSWQDVNYQGNLIWSLFRKYGTPFLIQTTITAIRSIIGVGPFWAMLRLVQVLESNPTSRFANPELWFLVFVMSFSGLLERVCIAVDLPLKGKKDNRKRKKNGTNNC